MTTLINNIRAMYSYSQGIMMIDHPCHPCNILSQHRTCWTQYIFVCSVCVLCVNLTYMNYLYILATTYEF